jgi:Ca2+-transporting ATPase
LFFFFRFTQFKKLNEKKEDRRVNVLRDGEQTQISVFELVVGDVLFLETGDVIPADGVLISGSNLKCDESGATGESDAVKKGADHDLFLLSGTKVLDGVGRLVERKVFAFNTLFTRSS